MVFYCYFQALDALQSISDGSLTDIELLNTNLEINIKEENVEMEYFNDNCDDTKVVTE